MKDPKEFYNLRVSFLTRVLTTEAGLAQSDFEFHNPATVRNPRKNEMDKLGYAYIGFIGKNKASNDSKANVYLTSIKVRSYKSNGKKGFAESCLYVDLTTISEDAMKNHNEAKLSTEVKKRPKSKVKGEEMSNVFATGLRNLLKGQYTLVSPDISKTDRLTKSYVFISKRDNCVYANHGTPATKKDLLVSLNAFFKTKMVSCEYVGKSVRFLKDENSPLLKDVADELKSGTNAVTKSAPKAKAKAKAAPKAKAKAAPKAKAKTAPKAKAGKKGEINLSFSISKEKLIEMVKENLSPEEIKAAFSKDSKPDNCNQVLNYIEDTHVCIDKNSPILGQFRKGLIKTVKQIKKELHTAQPG